MPRGLISGAVTPGVEREPASQMLHFCTHLVANTRIRRRSQHLRDEIGHVEIGSRWFRHACAQRGLDPQTTFRQLIEEYFAGSLRGPFHHEARRQAGFSEEELEVIEQLGAVGK